jgi:hypothetical protein
MEVGPEAAHHGIAGQFRLRILFPTNKGHKKEPRTAIHYLVASSTSIAMPPLFLPRKSPPWRSDAYSYWGYGKGAINRALEEALEDRPRPSHDNTDYVWFKGFVDRKELHDWLCKKRSIPPWEDTPYETSPDERKSPALPPARERAIDSAVIANLKLKGMNRPLVREAEKNRIAMTADGKIPKTLKESWNLDSHPDPSEVKHDGSLTTSPQPMTKTAYFASPARIPADLNPGANAEASTSKQPAIASNPPPPPGTLADVLLGERAKQNPKVYVVLTSPLPRLFDTEKHRELADRLARGKWRGFPLALAGLEGLDGLPPQNPLTLQGAEIWS